MNSTTATMRSKAAVYVDRGDLEIAFEFVGSGGPYENSAYICLGTGEIIWHSEFGDNEQELPSNVDDAAKYLQIPNMKELGLGSQLALDFVSANLPDAYDEVRDIFRRRGAYGRFKTFLERHGMLEAWYNYEQEAIAAALSSWCNESGVSVGA